MEFSEFIANKEPVDKLSQEFSIPSGIIVFDFSDFTFGPVPLTGDDTWGIEEIIIDDQPDTDKITFGIIENGHKELSEHLPENTTVVERVDEMEVTEIDDNDCRVIDIERDTIVEEKQ